MRSPQHRWTRIYSVETKFFRGIRSLFPIGVSVEVVRKPPKWVELVTSQTNEWMTAVRLQQLGDCGNAWPHYVRDASNCQSQGNFGKAALSYALAAECLETIGQNSLSETFLRLARNCYDRQSLTSEALADTLRLPNEVHAKQTSPGTFTPASYLLKGKLEE